MAHAQPDGYTLLIGTTSEIVLGPLVESQSDNQHTRYLVQHGGVVDFTLVAEGTDFRAEDRDRRNSRRQPTGDSSLWRDVSIFNEIENSLDHLWSSRSFRNQAMAIPDLHRATEVYAASPLPCAAVKPTTG